MAEALKNGILEPEDTDLIMNRIKNKVADCNSESDEEIIKKLDLLKYWLSLIFRFKIVIIL